MSGFGGFGSGGFGSTTNNNQSTGFGGFGTNTNTTSGGFGSSNTGTGFGATTTSNTGGGLFGNNSSSGFGSGGFGANTTGSAFGQNKTGFGATATTSGGGLFGGGGGTAATSGSTFGGFGGSGSTTAFGSGTGTSTGGLFGQSKPAFGSSTTGGGLFGGGGTTSGFGNSTTNTSTGFGASPAPTFGGGSQNDGTGKVPFSEFTEKDPSSTNTTNKYQTITTIDPYKNWSLEELRLVDYNQGRKYGNQNGQAGAFGTGTGFGGFGSTSTPNTTGFGNTASTTGGGLFGGTNSTSTPFGQQQPASTGFGSSTSGGLFGAKPATGGLFGSTSTTTTTQPSGGLFGGGSTGTGFGGGTTSTGFGGGSTTTGGGLFGSTQNKPTFGGGFGATNTSSAGTGFGSSTGFGGTTAPATGGGLFGSGAASTATGFGGQQPASTGGFSFGQQNQQAQPQTQTGGGLFGGGAFGAQNTQQKPGGLFGSTTTTTGGGLFGQPAQQQQQSTGGGLFGGGAQQQQSGGLFGTKPAGTGLFGNSTTGTTGGGLFGGGQPQQTQGGGLFGSNTQQQSGGLFGNKPATTGGLGSSLFGNTGQQQQSTTNGLFGGSQQQQPALGGSLFGNSQSQQQQPQQPQALTANLLQNPYGNDALFANIGTPSQSVGPIATPLSTSQKNKKQAIIPSYRLNPSASSRLLTPQKRAPGYGFSYSTYGTPGSAISNASPLGLGNSLLSASSYGRSLNKSLSTSNLRSSFSAEDSILNPGAFAITARGGTGSLKKLNINKNMNVRRSLFGTEAPPPEPRKSVSFEPSSRAANGNGSSSLFGSTSGALVRTESPFSEPSMTGANGVPEMSQVNGSNRGKELAIVPENGSPVVHPRPQVQAPLSQKDKQAGDYWMTPSEETISSMSREEKANVKNFEVGRQGIGKIVFSKVNFNEVDTKEIFEHIVVLKTRSATVYGDEKVAKKPPVGHGLNVPSTITLENSWPRAAAGRLPVHETRGARYEKHIERLKRVQDTKFVNYDAMTGGWTFTVDHFTTYGLPEDDEDESMMETSVFEEGPGTPTPAKHASKSLMTHTSPSSLPSPPESRPDDNYEESSPDDTFDFKKGLRKPVPGQYSDEPDIGMEDEDDVTGNSQSFLGERSVGSLDDDAMSQASESGSDEDQEMAGSFPKPSRTTEQSAAHPTINGDALKPKSILKASQTANLGTPLKTGQLLFGADWTEQLQRTVSPKKQDRAALRANQPTATSTLIEIEPTPKAMQIDKPFTNSIDLINSLFNQSTTGRTSNPGKFGASSKGLEPPAPKRAKTNGTLQTIANDKAFHNSTKPRWGPQDTLVYTAQPVAPPLQGLVCNFAKSIVGEHNDVRFAKFATLRNLIPETVSEQQTCTDITLEKGIPRATTGDDFDFAQFAETVALDTDSGVYEQRAWELANILFDRPTMPGGVPASQHIDFEHRLRKEKLSSFWKKLVHEDAQAQASRAQSSEEKALMFLSGGMVEEACCALIEGKNFHLATLVAQIGGDRTFRSAIATQLDSWRQLNTLSELDDHIRAIYELLAGNTNVCRGQKVAGIENKVSTFTLSSRFKLDWRRSFGLRLWYGIESDDLSVAIKQFSGELEDGTETVKPTSWFVEKAIDNEWNDPDPASRQDLLWSMLNLYTNGSVALDEVLAPENVSGNPMDTRFSFQLLYLFSARGIGSTSGKTAADELAISYASCLSATISSNHDALLTACWALLHLSEPQARIQSIRALLDQQAAILDPPDGRIFHELLSLRIPYAWMYMSRALYARAVEHDHVIEAQCLIEAGEWSQAHDVVCRVVGPKAVIEGDSDQLRELLGSLIDPDRKGTDQAAWDKGAGVYYDFIEMKDLERQKGQRWKELVRRLATALKGVMGEGLQGKDLTERAALQIMGKTVAAIATTGEVLEKTEGLRLPLTEDAYLQQSRALSLDYSRALLTAAH